MFHYQSVKSTDKDGGDDSTAANSVPASPSVAASPYWGESTAAAQPEGFSPFVGFCFTINYILGTGFLTVPWAFTQGGLALSTVAIILSGLCSDMAKNFLLETMARAEAMLDNKMHWIKRNPGEEEKGQLVYSPMITGESSDLLQSNNNTAYNSTAGIGSSLSHGLSGSTGQLRNMATSLKASLGLGQADDHGELQSGAPNPQHAGRKLIHRPPPKYLVKHRKFEVNSLCRVFIGKAGLQIYTSFICLYLYCSLWAYTSVFSSAIAKAAPVFAGGNFDINYLVYAIMFAILVVPMSCMELHEQVVAQVILTGARFLMLGLMVTTSSLCSKDMRESETFVEAPMFHPAGLDKMLPVMVFAHIYHHSIPGLAHPVADKKQLSGIYRATTIFSTIAYAFIGLVLGSAFGEGIDQSSNLNCIHFTGGTAVRDQTGSIISVAWWAKAISLYVLCFPAMDVVSAFPLNAITLGNNMMGSFYGKKIHEVEVSLSCTERSEDAIVWIFSHMKSMTGFLSSTA